MSSRGELPFVIIVVDSVRSFNGFVNLKSSMGVQKATIAGSQHEPEKDPGGCFCTRRKKAKSSKEALFSFQSELVVLESRLSKEQVQIVLELDSRNSVRARMV